MACRCKRCDGPTDCDCPLCEMCLLEVTDEIADSYRCVDGCCCKKVETPPISKMIRSANNKENKNG